MSNIILGSKSPRRQELLSLITLEFDTYVIEVDEKVDEVEPIKIVEAISKKKMEAYTKKFKTEKIIITADTIVSCDNKVLGKPKDYNEAFEMIKLLSGKVHEVLTCVTINYYGKIVSFTEITKVSVINMTDNQINSYLMLNESYDKAGAYGIQGYFRLYIDRIDGDYYNVMGLPVCRLNQELIKLRDEN